jgi:thiopeptide-type bacteriocin biosynthesis protein
LRRLERGDQGSQERWQLALRGIDSLLSDLGLDIENKLAVMRRVRGAFAAEHRVDPTFGRKLGERYREQRVMLEALIDPAHDESSPLQPGFEILRTRSEQTAPIIEELRGLAGAGRLTLSLEELAPSYIHMHANRMLRSAFRAQELVIYSFLVRLYESRLRRDVGKPTA